MGWRASCVQMSELQTSVAPLASSLGRPIRGSALRSMWRRLCRRRPATGPVDTLLDVLCRRAVDEPCREIGPLLDLPFDGCRRSNLRRLPAADAPQVIGPARADLQHRSGNDTADEVLPMDALAVCITAALTYRRDKAKAAAAARR